MLAVWTKQTTKLPQTQTRVVWDVLRRAWWWGLLEVISHIWQQGIEIYRISGIILLVYLNNDKFYMLIKVIEVTK
jgi:hypothetical protein